MSSPWRRSLLTASLIVLATGCTKPAPSRAEPAPTRPAQPSPAPTSPTPTSPAPPEENAMKPTPAETPSILGFALGAPYPAAIEAAEGWQLRADGSAYHTGEGTVEGMAAQVELSGKEGRLADVRVQVTATDDTGLAGSVVFARLKAALGEPTSQQGDVVRWVAPGREVTLQRIEGFAKGEDTARVEYTVRARAR